MKKLAFVLCALACISASCQKEYIDAPGTEVTASVVSELTKTVLGQKNGNSWPVLWQSGDRININGNESGPLAEGGDVNAVFSFDCQLAAPFKAAYPSSVMTAVGAGVLPATQDFTAGSFDSDAGVLLGTGDLNGVAFRHAMAYIAFRPTGEGKSIRSLELTAIGGEKLSGPFSTDYSTLTLSAEASCTVAVNCASAVALGEEIIVAVPAQTYSQGFKVRFTDSDSGSMERRADASFEAVAGHIYSTAMPYVADPKITELYMFGDASPAGWSIPAMEPFANDNGVFVWEGHLKASGNFRFQTQNVDFMPALVIEKATGKLVYAAAFDANIHDQLSVTVEGRYRVVVDVRDVRDMKYEVTLLENEVEPFVKELYMLGPAFSGGYHLPTGNPSAAFTGNDGIFTWEGHLNADVFRFQTQSVDYVPCLMAGSEAGKLIYVDTYEAAGAAAHLSVAVAGTYRIVVDGRDVENLTYEITLLAEDVDSFVKELYMLGPAFSGGYHLPTGNPSAAFTGNDGIFTWEGHLNADVFRFQTQSVDYVPCLMAGSEAGKLIYVDTYEAAGAASHLSVAVAGTYRIVVDGRDADNLTYTITSL